MHSEPQNYALVHTTERFRDEYCTRYKALYPNVLFTLLYTLQLRTNLAGFLRLSCRSGCMRPLGGLLSLGLYTARCMTSVHLGHFRRRRLEKLKPDSITLASSELAPNMFGASSELVRS